MSSRPLFTRRLMGLALAAGLVAGPALAQSITGTYRAEGRNPDGSPYSGTVTIAEAGSEVAISWSVGGQGYQGRGTRNGQVITIDWGDQYPIVYVRMPSGELHGTWANGKALERLIP